MGDGHSFYPDLALLAEVYDGMTAQEQTQWAEDKVEEELSNWGVLNMRIISPRPVNGKKARCTIVKKSV